jgi:hypothetical protein
MASTLEPLPLGEDVGWGVKGETGRRVDMMGGKKEGRGEGEKKEGIMILVIIGVQDERPTCLTF